jgi:nucleoside-diphosphate-sugar epimerase
MTVLVTGGAGFVGAAVCTALRERGQRVVVLDGKAPPNDEHGEHVVGDVTDAELVRAVVRRNKVTHIVHAASIVGVAASAGNPAPAVRVNTVGAVNVFEAAAEAGVHRVVDISSEEVYGDFAEDPVSEDAPQVPVSPYGITKYAVERLGDYYARTRGVGYVAVRLCWVYGPGFPRQRLPQPWLIDQLEGRPSVLARGGAQRIDFTFISDAVAGILAVLGAPRPAHRAYNIATGRAYSLRELAGIMRELWPSWRVPLGDGPLELSPGVDAARKGALRIDRAATELGYRPRIGLAEGLSRTAESLLERAGA